MNATEARAITIVNQYTLESVLKTIEAMAKGGYSYAAFEAKKLDNPHKIQAELTDLGFITELTENYFNIKW